MDFFGGWVGRGLLFGYCGTPEGWGRLEDLDSVWIISDQL